MKKILLLIAILGCNLMFSQATITKQLGDFDKLKVYNGIELELIQSEEQKLEIIGEKAEKVKVKNNNGTLKITLKFPDLYADGKVHAKLYYNKEIKVIDANEGAVIIGRNINQTQLVVNSQEGAFINLEVKTRYLRVKASSGGIIKLEGSAKNQDIDVNLYGIYHGYGLNTTDKASIRAGSGAKAEVAIEKTLYAKVSFGGSIFYKGNPEVIKDKKTAGGIIKKVD